MGILLHRERRSAVLEWGKKQLETVLGKTVTGIIGVFLLGCAAMWGLPKVLVTNEALAEALTKVREEIAQVGKEQKFRDTNQTLELTRLRIDYLKQQRFQLREKLESGHSLSAVEKERLDEIDKELQKLYAREVDLEKELNK
jgi:hypothetical protein